MEYSIFSHNHPPNLRGGIDLFEKPPLRGGFLLFMNHEAVIRHFGVGEMKAIPVNGHTHEDAVHDTWIDFGYSFVGQPINGVNPEIPTEIDGRDVVILSEEEGVRREFLAVDKVSFKIDLFRCRNMDEKDSHRSRYKNVGWHVIDTGKANLFAASMEMEKYIELLRKYQSDAQE